MDLWAPETFNPTNSTSRDDWLYDPHFIEDDITRYDFPDAPTGGGGPEGQSLPDLVPLGQNQGYLHAFLDTTQLPGRNLLRFSTAVGNAGAGPINLISQNGGTNPLGQPWINPDGTQNVLQGIYSYNGSSFTFDSYRNAGRMVWHNGHGHFHLEGYANYRLLQNVGGTPGNIVIREDGTEAVGDKIGFCLINILSSFQLPGGGSSTSLPGYGAAGQPSTGCGFQQGIHVGRADVYDAIYDGQWIDVTGVPNGSYFLEVHLDALNVIHESDESNNIITVPVTLNANPPVGGIEADRFEPNQTFATATDLGVLGHQTQPGLTIHYTDEPDYFKFEAASSGNYQVRINIGDGRDVNLFLYDNNQTLLASATSPSASIETISWNFVAGQTYYVVPKGFGTAQGTGGVSSNYSLTVSVNPTVNAGTLDGQANEFGGNSGVISLGRNGPTSSPLTVNFTVGGSATRGVDYEIYHQDVLVTGNSVVIGNEASAADLEIRPILDGAVEPVENVTVTLASSSAYVIGGSTTGGVEIFDSGPRVTSSTHVWQTSPHKLLFALVQDVTASFTLADISIINLGNSQTVAPQSFAATFDGLHTNATVTFNGVLPDGRYRATLTAAGITNTVGTALPANHVFDFFVMTADANHDARVDLDDFNRLAQNFGQTPRDASQGDFNYDGTVNLDDFNILAQRFGTVLPAARGGATGLFNGGKGVSDDDDTLGELA
jgi:hypothetical protein